MAAPDESRRRRRRSVRRACLHGWGILILGLFLGSPPSAAQDLDVSQYPVLLERAVAAHSALDGASPEALPTLLEEAVARDTDLVEWLEAFLPSPQFRALGAADQAVLIGARSRAEFLRSTALIQLDRCEEARNSLRELLDDPGADAELRPRLVTAHDEATACLERVRTARLEVSSTPAEAEVLVDGVLAGPATFTHEIEVGEHRVLVRAEGHVSEEVAIQAAEGETVRVELVLREIVEEPPQAVGRKLPTWYEWTLWSAGAAGITVGLVSFFNARDIEDQIDHPPEGFGVADPDAEQEEIDRRDAIAYGIGGVGIACAIAGMVLYLVRDSEESHSRVSLGGRLAAGRPLWVSVRF